MKKGDLICCKERFGSIWKKIEWDDNLCDYVMSGFVGDSHFAVYLDDESNCKDIINENKNYEIIKLFCCHGIGYSFKDYWDNI